MAVFVLGYAAAWFLFNLGRMPSYIRGATIDPKFEPSEAVAGLALFTSVLVLNRAAHTRDPGNSKGRTQAPKLPLM